MGKKVALVTGGGQGIGEAICKRLSKDGFAVAVSDINIEFAQKVADDINKSGGVAIAIKTDVSNRQEIFDAVDKTAAELGDFNVIVNNAGVAIPKALQDITQKDYELTYKINVEGVLWGIQAASNKMKELNHGGKIINATSQAGLKGGPNMVLYGSTKFAVRGMTQAAGRELITAGINVNAFAPGIVKTPMMVNLAREKASIAGVPFDENLRDYAQNVAQQRVTEPEEIAAGVSFLASDDSNVMVGQTLVIDGGMVFN